VFKDNYLASMEADILGISPGAVWRHTSIIASALDGENITPHTEGRNVHMPNLFGDILLSDLTNKNTTYSRQTSSHIHILGYQVKSFALRNEYSSRNNRGYTGT